MVALAPTSSGDPPFQQRRRRSLAVGARDTDVVERRGKGGRFLAEHVAADVDRDGIRRDDGESRPDSCDFAGAVSDRRH